jgi:dimethylargininase
LHLIDPFRFDRAIARRPGPEVVHGLRAGGGPDPTFAGVAAEHAAYCAALEAAGLTLTLLEPLAGFPDAIFVEDPALVFTGCAILLAPGAPGRAGEGALLRPALEARFARVIELPAGHVDGGDVLDMGDGIFIGLSARTDRTGAEALAQVLARIGRRATVVETPPDVLHLKTAASLVGDGAVLCTASLALSGIFARYRTLTVPAGEECGANVLRANGTIIAGRRFPATLDLLAGLDAALVPLENEQIARIDAGFTCMSLRWLEG